MVSITKNTVNTVVVTLTENTTITSPNYLFEFRNKETKSYSYCLVGTDLTSSTTRNEFVIEDRTSPDPLLSQVSLSVGDYVYKVYELTDVQVSALNFTSIDTSNYGVVEGPGRAMVYSTSTPNTFYSNASVTNTVYEG